MKVVSLNVGQPRALETPRGTVLTSIWKAPIEQRARVIRHNVEGDRQADLTVHGGPSKAVYAYAAEHYPYWVNELSDPAMPYGMFGENLTTAGLTEENVHVGDQFRAGSALLEVTQPRMPCFKLALRFGRPDMVKLFWKSGRSGIYFGVVEEGEVGKGDEIALEKPDPGRLSVANVVRLFKGETGDAGLFARAMDAPLGGSWKREIQERWSSR